MTNKKPVASTITVQVTPDLLEAITLIASTVPGIIKPTRHAVGRIALQIGLDGLRRDPSLIVPFLASVSPIGLPGGSTGNGSNSTASTPD